MGYNLTGVGDSTNLFEFFINVEEAVLPANSIGLFILAGVFIITIVALLKNGDPKKAFSVSCFLTSIVCLGLVSLGFLRPFFYLLMFILLGIGVLTMYLGNNTTM